MEKRLAADVNILPKSSSMYYWKGEIEEATEILLHCCPISHTVQHLRTPPESYTDTICCIGEFERDKTKGIQ
ncbi:UNVERIFIED_CONTAM: hypothetical protein FKN15_043745 [Acipenser sinensis]